MNPVLILPLISELANLTIKIITIMEEAKDVSPEESELIKLRMREARDKVSYIENKDSAVDIGLEEYPAKLKELYDTGQMPEREYIANMGVANAAEDIDDNADLIASLDRTIKRYK